MGDRHANPCGCQPRRCLHHGHVDRVRALRTAKNQNLCRSLRPRRLGHRPPSSCEKTPVARDCPPTNPCREKNRNASSKVTAAARTMRASSRLVIPGKAFCSSSIVGGPRSAASTSTGPKQTLRRRPLRRGGASRSLATHRELRSAAGKPLAASTRDLPFSPATRISSNGKPSRGTTRASDARRGADEHNRSVGDAALQPRAPARFRGNAHRCLHPAMSMRNGHAALSPRAGPGSLPTRFPVSRAARCSAAHPRPAG